METVIVLFAAGYAGWLTWLVLRGLARAAAAGGRRGLAWWRRRSAVPPVPPELTAPAAWTAAQAIPTWKRRGYPCPVLAPPPPSPAAAATPASSTPPAPDPTRAGGVIF